MVRRIISSWNIKRWKVSCLLCSKGEQIMEEFNLSKKRDMFIDDITNKHGLYWEEDIKELEQEPEVRAYVIYVFHNWRLSNESINASSDYLKRNPDEK
jgi:hypothetical protein